MYIEHGALWLLYIHYLKILPNLGLYRSLAVFYSVIAVDIAGLDALAVARSCNWLVALGNTFVYPPDCRYNSSDLQIYTILPLFLDLKIRCMLL